MRSRSRRKSATTVFRTSDNLLGPESVEDIAARIQAAEQAEEENDWEKARDIWRRLSALLDRKGRRARFQRKVARAQDRLTYDCGEPTLAMLRLAKEEWHAAYLLESDDAYTLYSLGYAETEIGDALSGAEATAAYESALDWLEQSLVCNPNDADAHHLLGWTCEKLGAEHAQPEPLLSRACVHLAMACRLDPDRPHSYRCWADALRGLAKCRDGDEARQFLHSAMRTVRRALHFEPDDAANWHKLGLVQRELAQLRSEAERAYHLSTALRYFRKALAIDDERRVSHYYAGLCCYDLGRLATTLRGRRYWYVRSSTSAVLLREQYPQYDHGLWLDVVTKINLHRRVAEAPDYLATLRLTEQALLGRVDAGSRSIALYLALGELGYQLAYEQVDPDCGQVCTRYARLLRRWLATVKKPGSVPEQLPRLNANCYPRLGKRRARLHAAELLRFVKSEIDSGRNPADALKGITEQTLDTLYVLDDDAVRDICLDGLRRAFDELDKAGDNMPSQNARGRLYLRMARRSSGSDALQHLEQAVASFSAYVAYDPNAVYAHSNWGLALTRLAMQGELAMAEARELEATAIFERAMLIRRDYRLTRSNYAHLLLQRAAHASSVEADHQLSRQALVLLIELNRDNDADDVYNLACAYARLGMVQEALAALSRARQAGKLNDHAWARQDPDLKCLRALPEFKALLC